MTISNIMVSIDLGAAAADRIQLSSDVAERFEANLTGVAARLVVSMFPIENLDESKRLFEIADQDAMEKLSEAQALFDREAGKGHQKAWRAARAEPTTYLLEQSRAADLVVVGRQGVLDGNPDPMGVSTSAILMEAGRPVLVAPPGIEFLSAKRIVVAWKDTREARRAVNDALPFLSQAERTHVVAVEPDAHRDGAEGAAEYLSQHGIAATTQLLPAPAAGAADEILRFAQRQEADLIVMGAYGHSRLREWIFGGVTHDILQTTPVCCLMSH